MTNAKKIIANADRILILARSLLEKIESTADQKREVGRILDFLDDVLRDKNDVSAAALYAKHIGVALALPFDVLWIEEEADIHMRFLYLIVGEASIGREKIENFQRFVSTLIAGLTEARKLIEIGAFEQARDCVNALHALPSAAIAPDWDAPGYWRIYLVTYQNKWGSTVFEPYKFHFLTSTPF